MVIVDFANGRFFGNSLEPYPVKIALLRIFVRQKMNLTVSKGSLAKIGQNLTYVMLPYVNELVTIVRP